MRGRLHGASLRLVFIPSTVPVLALVTTMRGRTGVLHLGAHRARGPGSAWVYALGPVLDGVWVIVRDWSASTRDVPGVVVRTLMGPPGLIVRYPQVSGGGGRWAVAWTGVHDRVSLLIRTQRRWLVGRCVVCSLWKYWAERITIRWRGVVRRTNVHRWTIIARNFLYLLENAGEN